MALKYDLPQKLNKNASKIKLIPTQYQWLVLCNKTVWSRFKGVIAPLECWLQHMITGTVNVAYFFLEVMGSSSLSLLVLLDMHQE